LGRNAEAQPAAPFWPGEKYVETTTRKPLFLFLLFGLFLLRRAQRAFLRLLLYEPPRSTRWSVGGALAGRSGFR